MTPKVLLTGTHWMGKFEMLDIMLKYLGILTKSAKRLQKRLVLSM